MNSSSLTSVIRSLVGNYSFSTGTPKQIATSVSCYPMAYLVIPTFARTSGTRHRMTMYDVTLHLMNDGAHLSPESRAELLGTMEEDALRIFSTLSEHVSVIEVEQLQMRPSAMTLTTRGDVTLTCTARIRTID